MVQPDRQGDTPDDAGGGMAEGGQQRRSGGRGWAEHRTVCGTGRTSILSELSKALEERKLPAATGQASGDTERRGKTRPLGIPTVKDRIVQTAVKFGHRTDLRSASSGKGATAFDRDEAARTHCGKWTGCSRKATPTWWMPTCRATSTASRTSG